MTDPEPFVSAFFAGGNRSSRKNQASWVEMLRRGRGVVLPRCFSSEDADLYCLAPTNEVLDCLLGTVRASLGPRWVQGEGSPGWDLRDPFDCQVARLATKIYESGSLVVRRLRLRTGEGPVRCVANALQRLATLLLDAPPRATRDEQGLAGLLREVRVGVAAGIHGRHDVDRALRCLVEQGLLAPINVDFLRTWAWAEMGRHRELLDDESCKRVQVLSLRPRMVTAGIAKAVWATYLGGAGATQSLSDALATYRSMVEPAYSAVLEAFRAQDGWLADAFRVLHGLAFGEELLSGPAAAALLLATDAPVEFVASVREELACRHAAKPQPTSAPSPADLVASRQYDAAVEGLRHQEPSVDGARLLWRCAEHVDSAYVVLQAWRDGLSEDMAERIRAAVPGLAMVWNAVRLVDLVAASGAVASQVASAPPAATWLEWLDRACRNLPDRDLRDLSPRDASAGMRQIAPIEADPWDVADRFCELLGATFSGRVESKVKSALPEMVGAWNAWQAPEAAKAKVADAITFYAATSELLASWRGPQFSAYLDLLDVRLSLGVESSDYDAAVQSLCSLVGDKASRQSVERAIDCAEILIDKVCANAKVRADFIDHLVGRASAMSHLLDEAARCTLSVICSSLGLDGLQMPVRPSIDAVAATSGGLHKSSGKAGKSSGARLRIGAYTLQEPAGRRFQQIAEQHFPVEVVLNHDHVETAALKHLCDLDAVIVVTRCAKHAATDAIGRYASKDKIHYAQGGGTSGMLRALQDYLDRVA